MNDNIAISVKNISKTFKIPHERIDTMRGAFVNLFKQNSYEEFKALDDVSFEVKKGEFFGIIGRNGSGKSTLLKILAGIYSPDKGNVKIHGRISPFLELGIGFNPELSGRDNVYLNATVLGLSKKQIDEKFDDIVRFSELERFIDQKIKNYSSGMQVRLAFSVAIHANRDILLMDEVLAVGDNNFQSKCLEEFNKYRDLGKTVILVTHDIGVVQRYCDRAMLVRNGKIVNVGNSDEVGNEYIDQNISDEEVRIVENPNVHRLENESANVKDKKNDKVEIPQKIAEIIKIEFLDKDGNVKNVFHTGDDLSLKVSFKIYNSSKNLNFGVAIYNIEDDYMCGVNTIRDKKEISEYLKRGFYQVNFKKNPFKENRFYVKASIVGNSLDQYYDYVSRSEETFQIFSRNKNPGLVEVNYKWL
jgi:ABC-type polysaccharide/polyol phosphate transport system ATPase subunit